MKFIADRKPLLEALQRCARVAERKSTIPILTHVLVEARKKNVLLSATNMDRMIAVELEAEIGATGSTTASVRALVDFAAAAQDGSQIEVEQPKPDARVTLRAGRARGTFPTLPPAEFPAFRTEAFDHHLALEGAAFAASIGAVAHAQSNEATRYYLNGIYLHRRGDRELVLVATDGHCLARTVHEMPEDLPEGMPGIILPRQAVADIEAMASRNERIQLSIGASRASVEAGGVILSTKLIDGTFPDYERVIPATDIAIGFEVDRESLVLAAKRCGVVIEDAGQHSMKMAPSAGVLQLKASNGDLGEICDEIDASTSTKLPIGVNPRYLLAALEAMGGKTVRVRYADAGAPITLIDPAQPDRLVQVVMPMRV